MTEKPSEYTELFSKKDGEEEEEEGTRDINEIVKEKKDGNAELLKMVLDAVSGGKLSEENIKLLEEKELRDYLQENKEKFGIEN